MFTLFNFTQKVCKRRTTTILFTNHPNRICMKSSLVEVCASLLARRYTKQTHTHTSTSKYLSQVRDALRSPSSHILNTPLSNSNHEPFGIPKRRRPLYKTWTFVCFLYRARERASYQMLRLRLSGSSCLSIGGLHYDILSFTMYFMIQTICLRVHSNFN